MSESKPRCDAAEVDPETACAARTRAVAMHDRSDGSTTQACIPHGAAMQAEIHTVSVRRGPEYVQGDASIVGQEARELERQRTAARDRAAERDRAAGNARYRVTYATRSAGRDDQDGDGL
jgi:hypothetical protein